MKIKEQRFLRVTTPSAHAATIEFWNDHPVFSWFGGSREGAGDIAIYLNNLHNDNETILVGDKDSTPRWNPILFNYDNRLYLFTKLGTFCDRWQTLIHDITDWKNDVSFEQILKDTQVLPAGLNGPVKTRPIVLPFTDETIICGSAVETNFDWVSYFENYDIIDGKWEFNSRSKPIYPRERNVYRDDYYRPNVSKGIIQPAMWVDNDGIHSFFRSSNGLDSLYYYHDNDYSARGRNVPIPTNLPNPNSGVDVVYHEDRLFLVSNPSNTDRFPLVIQELENKGDGKFEILDEIVIRNFVEKEDKPSCISQCLSYPYMVENDGDLHLVYTYGRSRIEYVVIGI